MSAFEINDLEFSESRFPSVKIDGVYLKAHLVKRSYN